MLTNDQIDILKRSGTTMRSLSEDRVDNIVARRIDESLLSDDELLEFLEIANALYRGGSPIISDADYDFVFLAELKSRNPRHPYLHKVEPESAFIGKTVELPVRMLSTDKAYSLKEIEQWGTRIQKASKELGKDFNKLHFKVTPKLDGFAAYDDGERLYTRGDGRRGTDITRVFNRGLTVGNNGERGLGAGEIVVNKQYFNEKLAPYFENARNFQSSVIKEKELEEHAEMAIKDKAAVFFPFVLLPSREVIWPELLNQFDTIVKEVWASVDYDVDGIIIEITDEQIKRHMGETRHHHRWQIAYKANVSSSEVKVLRVIPQTSRSGRVNPVVELEPTRLSGALIHRATAHHYKMVLDKGIGAGAIIELTRSGEVIPKIERVIQPASSPEVPSKCPSCGSVLIWDNDYRLCTNNTECPAQITNTMEHWFRMLGNVDGFASATIEKLYENGVRTIAQIYALSVSDFQAFGFGPKQSENLFNQLKRSRTEQIEDWRFLAAFGIYRLGPGNCEKLLTHYELEKVFELSEEQIAAIEGFAEKTASAVVSRVARIRNLFLELYNLKFNLKRTPHSRSLEIQSAISGDLIVFTGTMKHGSRPDMEREARALGAKIGDTVTGKTKYLVIGDNAGATKLETARQKGVQIITEDNYLKLIGTYIHKTENWLF